MVPLIGDRAGPIYEGWTLLAALAGQTQRLRLGVMVTNNLMHSPARLAKIAATVDVVSGGRLEFGIGVGAAPGNPLAQPEYDASGVSVPPWPDAVASLGEACAIIRRLWTEDVVDFAGAHHRLVGARCNPKPLQRPHPPILIGGGGKATLRIIAEHDDIWNIASHAPDSLEYFRRRADVLDQQCAAVGRDPTEIIHSTVHTLSAHDDPAEARHTLRRLIASGFSHLVLNLIPPWPDNIARWVTDELIIPSLD